MLKILKNRLHQKNRTLKFPQGFESLPEPYRGLPKIDETCEDEIVEICYNNCPQNAILKKEKLIDIGRCVFCGECERISNGKFVKFSTDYNLGASEREHLLIHSTLPELSAHLKQHVKKLFGKSIALRQVSAGGCNACEADTNVLNTPVFDLSQYGIQFVASPRHADGIHITGPITRNMKTALLETYKAIPSPKLVIASGACAISGGPFYNNSEIIPLESLLNVDLYIPGCPPHPLTTLSALLNFFKP